MALVMVIGLMMVMTVLITVIVSSTVFGLNFTSQTRASVQSNAAAEAGIDAVAVKINNDKCSELVDGSGNFSQTASVPAFEGQVLRQATAASGFTPGCPVASDHAYKIVSTGFAQLTGGGGYNRGDEQVLEAQWVRPTPPPSFDEAIRGDTLIYFHSDTIVETIHTDGDIYTKGSMTCASGMQIGGNVIAEGDITWTNSDCIVKGDVYAGGDIVYPVSPYSVPSVEGNIVALGSIKSGAKQTKFGYLNNSQYINASGTIQAGGQIHAYCSYPGRANNTNWTNFAGSGSACPVGTGTRVKMNVPGLSIPPGSDFEPLALTSEPWASWTNKNWNDSSYGGNAVGSSCGSHSGGGTMNITTNTRIDTTSTCSGGVILGDWGGLTLNLSADLVVYANSFKVNGKVTINSVDGGDHSVYFVNPSASATSVTCPAESSVGTLSTKITMSSGPWNQSSKIAVMFYTPGKIANNFYDFNMSGQLYGCAVDTGPKITVHYKKAGDASSSQDLSSFAIQYLREK
ncbi:hypothetical protein [Demequina aurantiaca]|uniref:hypothetical protein n=1 Tax=Demequina aurantiaca TaxID=676200 RepID=UPI003D32C522